jgi:outer membrane protein OmpA-like peptidoglycan-associated protein
MNKLTAPALAAAALLCLSACAPQLRVTLLPQPDGSASAVSVQTAKASATIDRPYEQGKVGVGSSIRTAQSSAETVAKDYAQVLSLKPAASHRYTLHFVMGSTDLLPESQALLPQIQAQAKALEGGEIIIVGHTDRVGDAAQNDRLSRERALALRQVFVDDGFAAYRVRAVGRGEREPIVPTADDVAETANRRVEILVR